MSGGQGKYHQLEGSNHRDSTRAKDRSLSVPTTVPSHSYLFSGFAHMILALIQHVIVITRRIQQSGFTVGTSTIDTTLALRLLLEIHREFSRRLNVSYVYLDIKAAFDSVDRGALWKALHSRGVPDVSVHRFNSCFSREH